jgi:hypothetical protein
MDATGGLKRRPGEGRGRLDDKSTVWGDDTTRPALAPGQTPSPQDTADRPAPFPLEATIPSRGGESAPAAQHSRHRIRSGPLTRGAEAALALVRTCFRSGLTVAQRVPAGVLVVPLALLLFLLTLSNNSITALTAVPLWVVLPPLVLLLLLLVFAQHGRLTVRTAVPVWTLLVPVTLLLLLLGLARASMPTAGGHHGDHSAAAARSNSAFASVTNRRLPKPRHAVAFTLAHARATTPSRNHPVCDPGQPC